MEVDEETIIDSTLLNKIIGRANIKTKEYNVENFNYNVEITYVFDSESVGAKSYVYINVGENQPNGILNKVEDIKEFLSLVTYIDNGEGIFIYKDIIAFKEEDSKIIQFMVDIYENYFSDSMQFFELEKMYLTNSMVKDFFCIMTGKSFNAIIDHNEYYNVNILLENLPLQFTLEMKELSIILQDKNGFPLPLTDGNEYFLYNHNIYYPDVEQRRQYAPFSSILKNLKEPFVCFNSKDNEKVIFNIFPKLRSVMPSIEISEEIKNNISEEPLSVKIYLDKQNKDITADVRFIYGDILIRAFINEVKRTDNKIVIRDFKKENEIIDTLRDFGFENNEDYLILKDSENILKFLTEGLSILQEKSEVFYSDGFKGISILNSSSYKAGISLNNNDLLEFNFTIEGVDLEDYKNIFRALRENKKYYRLKEGNFVNLLDNKLMKMNNFINYLHVKDSELFTGKIFLDKYNAMYIDENLSDSEMIYIEKNEAFQKLVNNIKNVNNVEFSLSSKLEDTMRNYQKIGFNWLKTLASCGFGGILADEMGLGKTLQAISFIESELEEIRKKKDPVIVVTPSSLIYNWENEVMRFSPSIKTLVIAGSKKDRELLLEKVQDVDMVITSYPLIRRDIENYRKINFSYCFIDEAQNIKNPNSQSACCVKEIKAKGYFAITGTPLENSLIELWSIFDFIMPGYMMSHSDFLKKYETPIVRNNDKEALRELIKHTKPFILRRFKKDVAVELPPKIEHMLVVEMTDEQKVAYMACLNLAKDEIDEEIRERGYNRSKLVILTALMRLRQICCDPSIFIKDYEGESSKMLAIDELIEESIEQGHRILLYSQFTSVLKLIRERFERSNVKYMYLDGQTKIPKRLQMVDDFNKGEGSVFLISLKAGGTGLNLTGADVVIHFDPWWNPAVEDQATDRAHRIGQEKTVEVIKLICRGTIEEKIYNLQQKKKEIIKNVIDNNGEEHIISQMSQEEIMKLFTG